MSTNQVFPAALLFVVLSFSSNILLSNDWTPKLADFGLCRRAESIESAVFDVTSAVGTKAYMAPEALKGYVSSRVDVYSYGMVTYTCLSCLISAQQFDLIVRFSTN